MHTLIPVNCSCLVAMGGLALLMVSIGWIAAAAAIWLKRLAVDAHLFVLR